jgi:hypothetical protein
MHTEPVQAGCLNVLKFRFVVPVLIAAGRLANGPYPPPFFAKASRSHSMASINSWNLG